jgi:hypothetical protein
MRPSAPQLLAQRKFEAKPCAEAEMNLPKASTEATLLCS